MNKKKSLIYSSITLLVASLFLFSSIPAVFASTDVGGPIIRSSQGPSLNWSGYAVSEPGVTSVSGTFTVPTVSGPGSVGGLPTDVSVWVGIDGYTSSTVEQLGVSGSYDQTTGTASYSAWWEMYPRVSMTIHSMTISSGDSISASVTYLGSGSFQLSMTDTTTGQSFSTTQKAPVGGPNVAQTNSAEWVVERAATIYKGYITILPLASFTPVTFSSETFTIGSGSPITLQQAVDSYTQYPGYPATPPSQPYWENMYIVSITSSGSIIPLDTTSSVSSNSFTVSFIGNGVPLPIVRV